MFSKLSNGYKIASPAAIVAIICFFLPWVFVSCNAQPVADLSGWELAAGTTVGQGYAAQQTTGEPIFFLVLFAAFGVLGLSYLAWKREYITKVLDGFTLLGIGALPLLILLFKFSGMKNEAIQQGLNVEFKFGLWGVVLAYLAVITGGVFNLKDESAK